MVLTKRQRREKPVKIEQQNVQRHEIQTDKTTARKRKRQLQPKSSQPSFSN